MNEVAFEHIELNENEQSIFQYLMFQHNVGFQLSMIDWVFGIKPQRKMIMSDTQHERIFHAMYPQLKKQVVFGTGKDGYKNWGVKKFTLDFFDEEQKIAYEIDGKSHTTDLGIARDNYRDLLLRYLCGIRTIRYTNEEVENMLKKRIKKLGVEHFGISEATRL